MVYGDQMANGTMNGFTTGLATIPSKNAPPPPPPPQQQYRQFHDEEEKQRESTNSSYYDSQQQHYADVNYASPAASPARPSKAATTSPAAASGTSDNFEPEKKGADEDENVVLDGEEALLDLGQLEELHQEAERMKALGNKHMAAQEYTRAYNAYSAALQLSPVGPSSHVFLSNRAAALLSLKRYAAAATDARRAVALAPSFGKAHARLGQALYFLKDYTSAVAAYEDAIRFEPDNQVTQTYLEKAKAKLAKQHEKVARTARGGGDQDVTSVADESTQFTVANSIATDPNASAAVVTTRGFAQKDNQAIKNIVSGSSGNQLRSQQPSYPPQTPSSTASSPFLPLREQNEQFQQQSPQHQQSPSSQQQQQQEEEPPALQQQSQQPQQVPPSMSSDPDPDFDEAVRIQRRAHRYLASKQYKNAIEEYTAALFLIPDDPNLSPQLHLGRAHALNGSRRHASAKNDAQLAIKIQPSPEAYSTLAKSLFYLKDYAGAIEAFDNCTRMLPPGETLSMFDQAYRSKAEAAMEEAANGSFLGHAPPANKKSPVPKLPPPRFVPREEAINSTPNLPPMPKQWPQQSPKSSSLRCGPEREVIFFSESLGIKLNRGADGIVRVLSVSKELPGSPVARKGQITIGDIVREAAGVDIRRPITNIMWGDTVALIKMAPRPISLIVAQELSDVPHAVLEQRKIAEREEMEIAAASETLMNKVHLRTPMGEEEHKTEITPPVRLEERHKINFIPSPANDESQVALKTNIGAEVAMQEQQRHTAEQVSSSSNDDVSDNNNNNAEKPIEEVLHLVVADSSPKKGEEEKAGREDGATGVTSGTESGNGIVEASVPDDGDGNDDDGNGDNGDLDGSGDDGDNGDNAARRKDDSPGEGDNSEQTDKKCVGPDSEGKGQVGDGSGVGEDGSGGVDSEVAKSTQNEGAGADVEGAGEEETEFEVVAKGDADSEDRDGDVVSDTDKRLSLREDETKQVGGEILFDRRTSISAAYNGWDNLRWMSYAGVRKVRFCQIVSKLIGEKQKRKSLFGLLGGGSMEEYETRKLVVYDEPSLILVLREPKDNTELQELLDLPDGVSMEESNTASFLVVESAVDPIACKLRLSPLTTVTSIPGEDDKPLEELSKRRRSCFELLTPSETIVVSAVQSRDDSRKNNSSHYLDSESFLETAVVERALIRSLCDSHTSYASSGSNDNDSKRDNSWKHQVILGTLHSYVVSGSTTLLEKAIMSAMRNFVDPQLNVVVTAGGKTYLDPQIVDAVDDNGLTPLQHACYRRADAMVACLVNAGAKVVYPHQADRNSDRSGDDNSDQNSNTTMEVASTAPLHICACNLDDKCLSTLLSVTYPNRPDPNEPDSLDRTPMYIAATVGLLGNVSGGTDNYKRDFGALNRCLLALECWGGVMMLPLSKLQHPVSFLASKYKFDATKILINNTKFRYPVECNLYGYDQVNMSLSAMNHYPIHTTLITLYKETRELVLSSQKNDNEAVDLVLDDGPYEISPESKIVKTLTALLEHGFEPNERIDSLEGLFDGARDLEKFVGFSPIQIVACIALEVEKLKFFVQERSCRYILEVIGEIANVLVKNGSRISLDVPPLKRPRSSDSDAKTAAEAKGRVEETGEDDFFMIERSILKIDSNKPLMELLGGKDSLNRTRSLFGGLKAVDASYRLAPILNNEGKSGSASFEEFTTSAGGNDDKSCAICWKAFGALVNRKQKCHITRRFVCDECSSKRVVLVPRDSKRKKEYRISDGQYLLACADASKVGGNETKAVPPSPVAKKSPAAKKEERSTTEEYAGNGRLAELRKSRLKAEKEKDEKNRESLFSKAASYVSDSSKEIGGQLEGLTSSLAQTRDALGERGAKLESLNEKTSELVDASKNFADMAKELRKQSESQSFFGW